MNEIGSYPHPKVEQSDNHREDGDDQKVDQVPNMEGENKKCKGSSQRYKIRHFVLHIKTQSSL